MCQKPHRGMEVRSPWLNSWHDPLSALKTVTSCVCMADLNGDGDTKLCIGDFDKKLKIYRGTSLLIEHVLLNVPIAMCVIYRDNSTPRIPMIAVAAGFVVYLYRQFTPYAKWCCPPVEISEIEQDIWNDLIADSITVSSGTKQLIEARDQGTSLSSRAADFLSLDSDALKFSYVKDSKGSKFTQQTLITCMEVMQKENENPDGIKLLVIGTENKQVLILHQDPVDSTYLCKVTLPSQPVLLVVSGVFDTEWKISVSCRDGKMYNIKNGDSRTSAVLTGIVTDLGSQAVSIARLDKLMWAVTMDKVLSSYSAKGKRMRTMILQDDVTEICTMSLKKSVNYSLLLVALATGEIRLYKESFIVTSFTVERPVIAMRFGSYGREENALIVIHGKGSITVKMWSRHADIDNLLSSASKSGPPPEQDVPLPVPKKTKLYIEQTKRECDQASDIHRVFQRDLCKLRLETARAYVKTLTEGRMVSQFLFFLFFSGGMYTLLSTPCAVSLGCVMHSLHHLVFYDG